MNDPILLADIKIILNSDMKAGKKLKAIEALIIRWTVNENANQL